MVSSSTIACLPSLFLLTLLPLLFGLLDRTHVHESVFRQVIPLAVADFFEAANRVFQRGDFTWLAGEDFGHEERLREESLDTTSTMHDQLVFFRQLVDTENRDDVLLLAVALQGRLHTSGDRVMSLADILRIENTAR